MYFGWCGGWTFFIDGWGWLEVYFEWVGLGGHLLLVSTDGCGCEGVDGQFL